MSAPTTAGARARANAANRAERRLRRRDHRAHQKRVDADHAAEKGCGKQNA